MTIARGIGPGERVGTYEVSDAELATGSTLGGPKVVCTLKASGAIERIYAPDAGRSPFGAIGLRHFDDRVGMLLTQETSGRFFIHPEHQEHQYVLQNGLAVHEDVFVLSGAPHAGEAVDPPAVYYAVELRNPTAGQMTVSTYAFADLRGDTSHDVVTEMRDGALIAWNRSSPHLVRVMSCTGEIESQEVTLDYGKAVATDHPGTLSGASGTFSDPLGVMRLRQVIAAGSVSRFAFMFTFATTKRAALRAHRTLPDPVSALARTAEYYADVLARSRVVTPSEDVNRGVLWAKANMLRVMLRAPTGWCFVNDPARSNNSVGRDTCWFAFGADYVVPDFARESLRAYVQHQERSGKVIEYYDVRDGKTEDYGLNINDNTPLLVLALWHHYNVTGDRAFLEETYASARRAADYILSQRNEDGLIWCSATGTGMTGIVGWRNVIQDYRLSGATTELNSECYAALDTAAQMARTLGRHADSARFAREAASLRAAINERLRNPANGLYYLSIDVDGKPRSDVTSDLVFPVMFGVAEDDVSARIIARLSDREFWTEAGIRTVPRDAPNYTPSGGWGLLGGVWVGVTFWYARAAAKYMPAFMDHALATSFRNYSRNPRQNNTVPGQFSEWLHGETLVNEGMMLSPWFPPRFVWAAIEGIAGLAPEGESIRCSPHLAPEWKWLGVQDVALRGERITWFAVRMPELRMFTNHHFQESSEYVAYEEDVSRRVHVTGHGVVPLALRQGEDVLLFVGNTQTRTTMTGVWVDLPLRGSYRMRIFNSLIGAWQEESALVPAERLARGMSVQIERQGFCLIELRQAT